MRLPVPLIAAALLALAGCGGRTPSADSSASSASSESGGSSDQAAVRDWALEYTACLRDNGAEDFPDPTFDADGQPVFAGSDDPDLQSAKHACEDLVEQSPGFDVPDAADTAAYQQRVLDFAACMRDHGIDMADPTFDDQGRPQGISEGDKDDPDARAVAEGACGDIMNQGGETP